MSGALWLETWINACVVVIEENGRWSVQYRTDRPFSSITTTSNDLEKFVKKPRRTCVAIVAFPPLVELRIFHIVKRQVRTSERPRCSGKFHPRVHQSCPNGTMENFCVL